MHQTHTRADIHTHTSVTKMAINPYPANVDNMASS